MDPEVAAALRRWPDVPAVYGWLALDARGNWRLRGEPIGNPALRHFIDRNYSADATGRWYFQNGPQRVYVALALAPLICRLSEHNTPISTHNGLVVERCSRALVDELGTIYLVTERGPAAIDDRDGGAVLARLVGEEGGALDDAALEAWLRGARRAAIRLPELGAAEPLGFERVPRRSVAGVLRFVLQPDSAVG